MYAIFKENTMPSIPAISGVLNNCSIGAALPSMLKKIETLAVLEGTELFEEQANLAEYKRIKNNFCKFYDIDKDKFTFLQFQMFLQQQSFFSKQMILGPVLREYIADNVRQSPEYDNPDVIKSIIPSGTDEPQNIGRYPGLAPDEANKFLYKPLGIEAKFFSLPENASAYVPVTQGIDAPSPEASEFKISVYHKNGHYELQPHDAVSPADNSHEPLLEFARQFGEGSAEVSSQAIEQLKIHVNTACLAEPVLMAEQVVTPHSMDSIAAEREHTLLVDKKIEHLARNVLVDQDKQARYKSMIKELVNNHETLLKPNAASENVDEELAKRLQEEELQAAGMIFRK